MFSVVAQVRASTRNSLVRALADDANTTVLDHIKVLEATGYVDFDALAQDMAGDSAPPLANSPAPPVPTADPRPVVPVTPSPYVTTFSLPPAASSPAPAASVDSTSLPDKRNVTYRQHSVRIVNRPWRLREPLA